jgi:hypothetical protein
MIASLAAATPLNLGAAQVAIAPGTVPPIELHLREVDAVDLLYALSDVRVSPMLVTRPAANVRVSFEHERIQPSALRERLGGLLGLHFLRAGDFDVWVPSCASPQFGSVDFPGGKFSSMNFNSLPAAVLLNLMADVEGLELSAPKGFPDVILAVSFTNRSTKELASVISLPCCVPGAQCPVRTRPSTDNGPARRRR